jgi:hypothetical protein
MALAVRLSNSYKDCRLRSYFSNLEKQFPIINSVSFLRCISHMADTSCQSTGSRSRAQSSWSQRWRYGTTACSKRTITSIIWNWTVNQEARSSSYKQSYRQAHDIVKTALNYVCPVARAMVHHNLMLCMLLVHETCCCASVLLKVIKINSLESSSSKRPEWK